MTVGLAAPRLGSFRSTSAQRSKYGGPLTFTFTLTLHFTLPLTVLGFLPNPL